MGLSRQDNSRSWLPRGASNRRTRSGRRALNKGRWLPRSRIYSLQRRPGPPPPTPARSKQGHRLRSSRLLQVSQSLRRLLNLVHRRNHRLLSNQRWGKSRPTQADRQRRQPPRRTSRVPSLLPPLFPKSQRQAPTKRQINRNQPHPGWLLSRPQRRAVRSS